VEYYDEELDWETCRDVGIYTHAALRIRAINTFHLRKCCKSPKNGVPAAQDGKFAIALGANTALLLVAGISASLSR